MLTAAAETIRFCVRVYEWSGLYVPVVHARHAKDLVQEPGPYILGFTAECRSLFTAPSDALVIDLDRNFVLTSSPPTALSPGQRNKLISRLTQALHGDVAITGVPTHLRSAYAGGKLVPAGQIIVMRGEVESIQDPEWWNQDDVMSVLDHVCEKMGRNTGIKAIFGGAVKKPLMTKVSLRHLNEIVRERNQYSRDAMEAWQDFINLKGRMDTELQKVTKRNNFLLEEVESWKQQVISIRKIARDDIDFACSLRNSKLLPRSSRKRHKSSKQRSRRTRKRIVGSVLSLTSRRRILPVLHYVWLVQRSKETKLLRLWLCNRKLLNNSSESGRETRRILHPFRIPVRLSSANVMRPSVLSFTSVHLSMVKLITWSTLFAP